MKKVVTADKIEDNEQRSYRGPKEKHPCLQGEYREVSNTSYKSNRRSRGSRTDRRLGEL